MRKLRRREVKEPAQNNCKELRFEPGLTLESMVSTLCCLSALLFVRQVHMAWEDQEHTLTALYFDFNGTFLSSESGEQGQELKGGKGFY